MHKASSGHSMPLNLSGKIIRKGDAFPNWDSVSYHTVCSKPLWEGLELLNRLKGYKLMLVSLGATQAKHE